MIRITFPEIFQNLYVKETSVASHLVRDAPTLMNIRDVPEVEHIIKQAMNNYLN